MIYCIAADLKDGKKVFEFDSIVERDWFLKDLKIIDKTITYIAYNQEKKSTGVWKKNSKKKTKED